ncbi:hypothetical protein R0J93_27105, partial [Pseudoalteromonas sp. SIMBA_148]
LEMKLDDTTWVPFSIANAASDDGVLELHIQHWPERSNSARLRSLLVADIAPVAYGHGHDDIFAAFEAVRDARPASRKEADTV